jgi:lysophospholipase L1-like esterase
MYVLVLCIAQPERKRILLILKFKQEVRTMKGSLKTAKTKVAVGLLCLCILSMPFASALASVVMNEIMYHPPQIVDDNYEFLELYNTGSSAVNLQNWVIDGIGFTFPAGASIGPNAYLVLAKDPNQVQAAYGFLPSYAYTGKLSNSGEALKILDANGIVVDEVDYTTYPPWPVTPDELGPSLERIVPTLNGNTPRNWHASIAPAGHTGGAINSVNAASLPPWIENVQHGTVQPGTPITVTASVQDATTVNLKYIINFGTPVIIPMHDDGLSGDGNSGDSVYGATIPAQPLHTLIRYRIDTTGATGSMGFPRDDDTVNYTGTFIEDDASVITGLPIFHWLIDPNDYNNAVATAQTDVCYPALLYYNGTLYDNVQIHARGQTSRSWYKKSWKFYPARNHDFFIPGLMGIPVDNFNLQASYSDKSYMREYLSWHLFEDVGHPYSQFFPVRLYQNGQFFGLYFYYEDLDKNYLTRNGLDADTGASYEAASDCRYYPIAQLPTYYDKHRPDDGDFNDLYNFLNGINNLTGQAKRNFIFDNLDIPRVLNYLAAMVVMHDNDAVAKNYYLYRDNAGTKRWYILPWDKDLTWGRNYDGDVLNDEIWANVDTISGRTNVSPSHPLFGNSTHEKYDYLWNRLIDVLFNETDFRNMYFRRLRTEMDEQLQAPGTPYTQRKIEKSIDEQIALMDTEAAIDTAKWLSWGQYQTIAQAAQILKDSYLTVRRTHLFVTHRVAGEIPEAQTPGLPIVINEIMYNPAGGDNDEFIELYNPSTTEFVDMSGWQLSGVELTFVPGTVLPPQSYLVVVKNDVQFRTTYGSGKFVAAQYEGTLDNTGEGLVLTDRQGNVIDQVQYSNGGFWPVLSSGQSIELIDASKNNNHPMNWEASTSPGGTPGAINSMAGTFPYIPDLKVNEVLSVNTSLNKDEMGEYAPWIEIYNASPNAVDLGGMFLTDDYNNPAKWAIPTNTVLNSGQWMIFWADAEPNEGPLHTNFALNSAGGSVGLYNAAGIVVDYLDYGALAANISYGKYPDGVTAYREFPTPTPAAQNYVAPVPIILNEYTGVADTKYLKDNASDTYWGRVLGNGGDWFELVVTQDHLDIRGWQLVVVDNGVSKTLTLTSNNLWADLRAGTIITVSENKADDISTYDPPNGKWWINVQAKAGGSGTYISATAFDVSQTNSQITIRDSNGTRVFGPAGEGIKPASGIGNDEIFHLEEDPGALITERSNYTDGSTSTFGAPNIYTSGKVQDFSKLRVIPDTGAPTPNPMTWKIVPTTTSSNSITMIATTAFDPSGAEYYFNNITDPTHDSNWQSSTYFKDKNLSPNTMYSYRVKARDKSPAQNETGWSVTGSAVTTPATVTFVAVGAITSSSSAITPALPAGISTGDILLLFLETSNQAISIASPNNGTWTEVANSPQGTGTAAGSTGARLTVFWSRYNGTQGAPTTSDSGDHQLGQILAFRGAATSGNPWDVTYGGVEAASDTSGVIPGVITTLDNTLIVAAIATSLPDASGTANFSSWTNSNLTELTERADNTVTSGNGGGLGIATGKKAAAGIYGTTAVTLANSAYKGMMSIALKPGINTPGQATNPNPANLATDLSINTDLSWTAGTDANLHDVYFGTVSPGTFRSSQTGTTYDLGTLANGTTYYWRIDPKNAGGTTTGTVWQFTTIPLAPGAATNPSPVNSVTGVDVNVILSWTAGSGATSHDVYFGTADPPLFIQNQAGVTYDPPGAMAVGITYYWRIDEKNGSGTTTGTVWSFTTLPLPGQASSPNPANTATNFDVNGVLSWTAGSGATSHDVYFGTADPPLFIQNQAGVTYDPPGSLATSTIYYWRIDERNGSGATTGTVWNFTTSAMVPDVVGVPLADANSNIIAAGLTVGTITYEYRNTVPAGNVISQNPTGGTAVDIGSSVDLVVSLGRPVVPNVVGMTQSDANTAIISVDNLQVGIITRQYSDTVATGLVISQNPVGGTEVNIGDSVNFSVSLGMPLITIMPVGDSITRGWWGSTYADGYRKPLYDKLMTAGYSFDFVGDMSDGNFPDPNHEGHDGWRADQILTNIGGWLVTYQPDVVLLHIGTNDITQGNQDANEVNGILNVIDGYENDSNEQVTVILALIINRTDSNQLSQATTAFNDDVNAMALNRIAGGDDIIIVNMENALNYSTDMADAVHPNDLGYAKMADVWLVALNNILPPSITSIPITDVIATQQYHYDVNASGCPEPTYELIICPNDMTIDHNTGLIEWWPALAGDFNVTVRASNGQMPDVNQSFVITVLSRPTTIRSNGTGGGDWNTDTTWVEGFVPRATDDVIIQGSDTVTLISAGSCTNLTMNAGTTLSLDINSVVIPGTSWNLAPASTVIYNGPTTVQSAPTYGNLVYSSANGGPNGNLTVLGNLYITANTLRGIADTSGTYTHNVSGDVIVSGTGRITAVNQKNPISASCTWNIGGNLTLGSTSNRIQFYESAGPHAGSAVYNINGNLTVGSTSYIMLKSTSATTADYPEGIINLKGNFVHNGSVNVNSSTSGTSPGLSINFVGTSPQDWSGSGSFSISSFSANVNINNAAGVTLSRPQEISDRTVVVLTNGKLTTTSTNLLKITNGSLIGGSSSSYINGPLGKRIVAETQSVEFPVGDATKYTPVRLEFVNVVAASVITVSTTQGIHPQIATSGLDSSKTLNRFYKITKSAATFDSVTATFNFDPTDVIGGADPTKYIVKKFDTDTWSTPTRANPLATSIQAMDVTSFSDFAVGQLLYDLDGDGSIDYGDLAIFCENWLKAGEGDFDNNGIVDFYDFAVFGPAW